MVVSNKKVKQKLGSALAESLAVSFTGTTEPIANDSTSTNPELNSHSLQNLVCSESQKPRLPKKEKRRKTLPLQSPDIKSTSNQNEEKEAYTEALIDDGNDPVKKNKKRKRDGEVGLEENKNKDLKKKNKKKKKKNKKTKKKQKTEGQSKGVENEGGENGLVKEAVQINDSRENGEASNKVYVGGIPYYSTEDDIRSYFDSCGTITEVDCMTFPESGKFRGIAIISFKREAAAKRALALDGADMGGLFLKIQPYKATRANKSLYFAPEMVEGYNRIYVGNLSWNVTEDEVRKFLSGCKVSSIRFGMDKDTQEFRGYAHVDFTDGLSLRMALKLDNEIICERPVRIRCAVPRKGAKDSTEPAPSTENAAERANENNTVSAPTIEKVAPLESGKIKRRTCYECGERGHISSACPKRQAADPKNSS